MATISEVVKPARSSLSPIGWLRKNLFSSWYNALLTLIALSLLYVVLSGTLKWALASARWGVVATNLRLFMIGPFPPQQAWRVLLCVALFVLLAGISGGVFGPLGRGRQKARRWVVFGWLLSFPLTLLLLRGLGGSATLPRVGTNLWGGLLLTFLLAVVGIVASFPLGILLALGRRSDLPAIHLFSTLYIELVRGVPLVTVLFMAQIMLPLFLPDGIRVDKVMRAMIGLTLFTAPYIAENVRGGLQAVPLGQYEAAKAVGLSNTQMMVLIVLPQALRAVIPAIVGQFITLFKDTSLVAIVGLLDLLNIARSVIAQPQWMGLQREVYLFVAVIYFIFSYAMSYASRKLEVAMGVGER